MKAFRDSCATDRATIKYENLILLNNNGNPAFFYYKSRDYDNIRIKRTGTHTFVKIINDDIINSTKLQCCFQTQNTTSGAAVFEDEVRQQIAISKIPHWSFKLHITFHMCRNRFVRSKWINITFSVWDFHRRGVEVKGKYEFSKYYRWKINKQSTRFYCPWNYTE